MKALSALNRPGSPCRPALLPSLVFATLCALGCHGDGHDTVVITSTESFDLVSSSVELEPNDESASPNFLGVLRPGQSLRVIGHAEEGDPAIDPFADEFDGFSISLTEASEIEFSLSFDDSTGELDTWIFDPVIDDIALFFESDFSPESGFFFVNEPVLDFHIVVRAFSGHSNYTLDVFVRPIIGFASTSASAANIAGSGASSSEPAAAHITRKHAARSALLHTESSQSRELACQRYCRASHLAPPLELESIRSGSLLIIDSDGQVQSLPVFTQTSGLRVISIE